MRAGVGIGLGPEISYYRFQVVFLINYRHIHGIVVALAAKASAGEIERIYRIAELIESVEIVAPEMVRAVESVAYNCNAVLIAGRRYGFDTVDTAAAVFDPTFFDCRCIIPAESRLKHSHLHQYAQAYSR